MSVDTSGASVALGQLTAIPFGTLIGGPLDAVVEAQATAAETSINFIKEVGFQENAEGETEAITISFLYQSGGGVTQSLTVPILAIVPIPFIQIDTVSIDFKAKISASGSSKQAERKSVSASARASFSYGGKRIRASLSGSISSKKDSVATRDSTYSVEYTIDVGVNASQAGMPAGLAVILKILEESIVTREPAAELMLIPQGELRLTAVDQTVEVDVIALGANNKPVPGVTITPTSADTGLLDATAAAPTDPFGRTTVTLKVLALPTAEQVVAIEFEGAASEFSASETLEVTLPAASASASA